MISKSNLIVKMNPREEVVFINPIILEKIIAC